MKLWWLTAIAQAMLAAGTALQAFLLLHASGQVVFGQFALVMLWLGLCLSLLSALTGAPALIRQQAYAQALWLQVNRWLSLLLSLLGIGLFLCWQLPLWPALLLAVSHYCLLSRSLQRQLLHQQGQSHQAAIQDLWYGAAVALATLLLFVTEQLNLAQLALVNALLGLCLQMAMFWQRRQARRWRAVRLQPVSLRRGWPLVQDGLRRQGRAAFAGVLAVELIANGYLYLIGSWHGPAAVAPFAAVLLLYRPVAVLLQGVSQRWRPELWQLVQQQLPVNLLLCRALWFGVALVLGNSVAAIALLYQWPALVWPDLPVAPLLQLLPVVTLLVLARVLRQPRVLLLQAQNQFAALARIELQAAAMLLPLCAVLLWLQYAPIWLMIAALLAEVAVTAAVLQKDLS